MIVVCYSKHNYYHGVVYIFFFGNWIQSLGREGKFLSDVPLKTRQSRSMDLKAFWLWDIGAVIESSSLQRAHLSRNLSSPAVLDDGNKASFWKVVFQKTTDNVHSNSHVQPMISSMSLRLKCWQIKERGRSAPNKEQRSRCRTLGQEEARLWRKHLFFFSVPVCAIAASGVPGGTFVSMNRFSTLYGWSVQRQGWRVKGWIWSSEQARSAKANSWLDYQRPLEK
jgi:hypothetical protein